ncbi:hypothetical protein [Providencia phage PSTCR5]|uniref:Uncharacterized protein n=1 Tax=Providencia phage PSTCR5 TaxID=2783547 RepID=A0A873WHK2_9CAUD|nr:hypothetical protein KNV68_gp002 [Providencia phage PSTCR5]QPB12100.1 hypothetical protein [Providencia phage PSTCR5]
MSKRRIDGGITLHPRAKATFREILVYEFMLYHGWTYGILGLNIDKDEDYAYSLVNGEISPTEEDKAKLAKFMKVSVTFINRLLENN